MSCSTCTRLLSVVFHQQKIHHCTHQRSPCHNTSPSRQEVSTNNILASVILSHLFSNTKAKTHLKNTALPRTLASNHAYLWQVDGRCAAADGAEDILKFVDDSNDLCSEAGHLCRKGMEERGERVTCTGTVTALRKMAIWHALLWITSSFTSAQCPNFQEAD